MQERRRAVGKEGSVELVDHQDQDVWSHAPAIRRLFANEWRAIKVAVTVPVNVLKFNADHKEF